jgi:transposase InsO family protein
VTTLCRVLEVSASGYRAWRWRAPSARALADAGLSEAIRAAHRQSRECYGAPRIHAELRARGLTCSRKRVARLMREAGIRGVHRRRFEPTTVRDPGARPAPDLVARDFSAAGPDRLWVADITELPTWQGPLHLAAILDVRSRRCVGWSMGASATSGLVVRALDMALAARRPTAGLIHHSDQGCQHTSLAFGRRMREAGIAASMGSVGDSYDCETGRATWAA